MGERTNIRAVLEGETVRRVRVVAALHGQDMADFYEEAFRRCLEKIRKAKEKKQYVEMRELPEEAEAKAIYMDGELARVLAEEFYAPAKVIYYTAVHEYLEELEAKSGKLRVEVLDV